MTAFARCALLAALFAPPARAEGPTLLVANKADSTLSIVDARSLEVVATVPTGRRPHEVAATPDGRLAFVADYGAGDTLTVIDLLARRPLPPIALGDHRDPHGLVVGADGATLFATCEGSREVIAVEVASRKIVRALPTDQEVSHMVARSPSGRTLYVSDIRSGSVTVLDASGAGAPTQVEAGKGCEGIDATPDGREVWATNKEDGTLTVLDAGANRAVATLPCPGRPIRVKFAPDGKIALVSCARSGEVALFDVPARAEVARIAVGSAPIGLAIEPHGDRAFVAATESDRVIVLDLRKREVAGAILVGREPDGLAIVGTK